MKGGFFFILIVLFFYSCTQHNLEQDIKVEEARGSSNILECDKMFGENTGTLEEKNEILLQTGLIDTTDEHLPIKGAVIHINENEIFLNFINAKSSSDSTIEAYSGEGYLITLSYTEKRNAFNSLIYVGSFIIEKDRLKSEYKIEGRKCTL